MLRITNIWFVIKKKSSVLSISFPYCSKSKCALIFIIFSHWFCVLHLLTRGFEAKRLKKKSRKRNYFMIFLI